MEEAGFAISRVQDERAAIKIMPLMLIVVYFKRAERFKYDISSSNNFKISFHAIVLIRRKFYYNNDLPTIYLEQLILQFHSMQVL